MTIIIAVSTPILFRSLGTWAYRVAGTPVGLAAVLNTGAVAAGTDGSGATVGTAGAVDVAFGRGALFIF